MPNKCPVINVILNLSLLCACGGTTSVSAEAPRGRDAWWRQAESGSWLPNTRSPGSQREPFGQREIRFIGRLCGCAEGHRCLACQPRLWPPWCWWLRSSGASSCPILLAVTMPLICLNTYAAPTEICAEALDTRPHFWSPSNVICCTNNRWSESSAEKPGDQPCSGANRALPPRPRDNLTDRDLP